MNNHVCLSSNKLHLEVGKQIKIYIAAKDESVDFLLAYDACDGTKMLP